MHVYSYITFLFSSFLIISCSRPASAVVAAGSHSLTTAYTYLQY